MPTSTENEFHRMAKKRTEPPWRRRHKADQKDPSCFSVLLEEQKHGKYLGLTKWAGSQILVLGVHAKLPVFSWFLLKTIRFLLTF